MSKEINPRLKPCPFCGSPPYEESYDRLIIIGCEECDYHMSFLGLVGTKKTDVPIVYEGGVVSDHEFYNKDAHKDAEARWNRRGWSRHENRKA